MSWSLTRVALTCRLRWPVPAASVACWRARIANGSTFYHADGAGNITGLMDGQQNMAARYMYGPFGNQVNQQGRMAGVDMMGFSSMPQAHGIVFYPGRPYLTSLQRWGSPDPLGALFDTNPYRVNYNSPLRYIDPDGLAPQMTSISLDASTGAHPGAGYTDYNLANGPYRGGPGNPLSMLDAISPDTQASAQNLANSLGLGNNPEVVAGIKQGMDLLLVFGLPEMEGAGELSQLGKLGKLGRATDCPKKGIYQFTGKSGKPYVGQSQDIRRRLQQHLNSEKLPANELPNVQSQDVFGDKTAREIAEQRRIDSLGGIQQTENQRNPIGPNRQQLLQP